MTLDTSASINSLTLGGASGSSVLIDPNHGNYTVNIAGALTINQTGTLTLTGDSVIANGNSTNAGTINLSLSTLTVNANFTNSGTLTFANNIGFLNVSGTLTNSGTINDNYMSQLTVGGDVINSGSLTVFSTTITGNLMNEPGSMLTAYGLTVGGNVVNDGDIEPFKKNSLFTVTGELTNNGLFDPGYSTATVGSLNNSGLVYPFQLTVHGDTVNSGTIYMGWCGYGCGSQFISIGGTLTNTPTGDFEIFGPYIGGGAANIVNSGSIDLMNSASLSAGNLANSGTVNVAGGTNGGSSLTVEGRFTNSPGGVLDLVQGSTASIANLINVGTVMVGNGSTLTVPPGAHAPNSALAGFLNAGTVDIASGATISSPAQYMQTAGETTVDGRLTGVVNLAGGSLYGNNGTISGNVTSNANFNIGDAEMTVGELSIMGNYTQRANGSLTFDIASLNSYDQLNVSGHAQLNGLMTVESAERLHPAGWQYVRHHELRQRVGDVLDGGWFAHRQSGALHVGIQRDQPDAGRSLRSRYAGGFGAWQLVERRTVHHATGRQHELRERRLLRAAVLGSGTRQHPAVRIRHGGSRCLSASHAIVMLLGRDLGVTERGRMKPKVVGVWRRQSSECANLFDITRAGESQ